MLNKKNEDTRSYNIKVIANCDSSELVAFLAEKGVKVNYIPKLSNDATAVFIFEDKMGDNRWTL